MSPLSVIITIAAYFAILFTVSYIAGRKADNAGFFVGNRKSSWYVVAFAMIGSSISGVTYVSVPGMVAASNFGYLQMVLGFIASSAASARTDGSCSSGHIAPQTTRVLIFSTNCSHIGLRSFTST